MGHEQLRGVGDLAQAVAVHVEDADLVGRPEAVLGCAQDAEGVAAVALKIEHRIDHMLQHPWPGN